MNFIDIEVENGHAICQAGRFPIEASEKIKSKILVLGFRPEDTYVVEASNTNEGLFGEVLVNEFHGDKCVLTVKTEEGQLKVIVKDRNTWKTSDKIVLSPDISKAHLFDKENNLALQHGRTLA